jgi:hypothetical protein
MTVCGGVIKVYLKKSGHQFYDEPAKDLPKFVVITADRAGTTTNPRLILTKKHFRLDGNKLEK